MNRADDLFAKLTNGGEAAIDELIAIRKSEELFLDFKRSGDNGTGVRLHDSDSKNFGKAISGFGNSEGGVVVWGVDCSPEKDGSDVATKKVPIQDAAAFASRLEGAVSRCTIPAHSGVRSVAVTRPGGVEGFVISLIPKSNAAPHQTIGALQYFMRAGSDFLPVPHGVLAGMFGRRPQPSMSINKILTYPKVENGVVSFDVGLAAHNLCPGIARDIFLTVTCYSAPCGKGSLAFGHEDLENWIATKILGVRMSYLTKPAVRLAPECFIMPTKLVFRFSAPFTSDLDIAGTIGCEGGTPYSFRLHSARENIERAHKGIINAKALNLLDDDKLNRFRNQMLGFTEDSDTTFESQE